MTEPTLGHVFQRVGMFLLSVEAGAVDRQRHFSGVVFYDEADPPPVQDGSVVLVVNVGGVDEIATLMRRFGAQRAAAVIVREPFGVTDEIRSVAAEFDIALISLVRGTSWMQIADLLSPGRHPFVDELWSSSAAHSADGLGLFEVANALSSLLNTPITIEDLSSHVLAFSANQVDTDRARTASVLGHQVPKEYRDRLIQEGAFRKLFASARPIFVGSVGEGVRPRVAMRISAGAEMLGSIWAVADEPLEAQRETAMMEAAAAAAIAMLRTRIAADASRRIRGAMVAALIGGGPPARETAAKMRGTVTGGCVIAACLKATAPTADVAGASAELERAASALGMLIHSEIPGALTAVVGDILYTVVPAYDGTSVNINQVRRLSQEFARRVGRDYDDLVVGVGERVDDIADLDTSRRDADLVLRVLCSVPMAEGMNVALSGDVQMQSLLLQMSDLMARDHHRFDGPIATLREYDAEHQATLEDTLRVWLESFGDVGAAAASLRVPKSTYRYRLSRIVELTGVNLDDPEVRFHLMLQFHLITSTIRPPRQSISRISSV